MIAIIDIGGNNLTSLGNALQRLGYEYELTHSAEKIMTASHVILPGVGSASAAMAALRAQGLIPLLQQVRKPMLGICLGMQLLFESSAEGNVECLGLLPGEIRKLNYNPGFPVPHMGWNRLNHQKSSTLLKELEDEYVYFVHGYAAPISQYTIASCEYFEEFSAIVRYENIVGMQFHPEKSANVGLQLLNNFLELETV